MIVIIGIIALAVIFTFIGTCTPEAEVMFYDAEDAKEAEQAEAADAGLTEVSEDGEPLGDYEDAGSSNTTPAKPPVTVTYAKGAGSAGRPKLPSVPVPSNRSAYASQTYVPEEEQRDATPKDREQMVNDLMGRR